MRKEVSDLIDDFFKDEEKLKTIRETLLSHLVLFNEIPAPTFKERDRALELANRFTGYEMLNCYVDELDNAFGIIPGKSEEKNILVVAHLDTLFPSSVDHVVSIKPDHISGAAVGDNGLGVAALATLPYIIDQLGLEFNSNIILMGSARSLGTGDLEGLRSFLDNTQLPITGAICIEGVKLGRLSYSSIGMLRGEITFNIPEEYDWTRFNSSGAIVNMNEIINHILEIPLPKKPKTSIVLGSIEGGSTFNSIPTKAKLKLEIRSESKEKVDEIYTTISDLAEEMSSTTGSKVMFNEIARRSPGGTEFSHPINATGREILKKLNEVPRITPSTSEVSALIAKDIPAITIGLTTGEKLGDEDEVLHLEPMYKGIAQLVGLLQAIDLEY